VISEGTHPNGNIWNVTVLQNLISNTKNSLHVGTRTLSRGKILHGSYCTKEIRYFTYSFKRRRDEKWESE